MKFTSDPELKNRLIRGLRQRFLPRTGNKIHVTELTLCLRKALYDRLSPAPPTEVQLGYFLDGARRHLALQYIHGGVSEYRIESSRLGVVGTIDLYEGGPIEFKSTRTIRQIIPRHYQRQLGYYMLLTDAPEGRLIIQKINPRGGESFLCSRANFESALERANLERELFDRADEYGNALSEQNPSHLPRFFDETDEKNPRWLCKTCLYKSRCGAKQ